MWPLSPVEIEALSLSAKVAVWAVALSLPPGIMLAWFLARKDFPGKSLLNALVHLPLVVPPVVVGYGLLVLLGRNGPLGAWLFETLGITVAFTWKGAAIAAGVISFPLMVRAIRLSVEGIDERYEAVAATLGASKLRTFFSISLPLALPGVLTGATLAFARCLGEFGATITFVSNIPGETRTLPLALYSAINTPGGEETALRIVAISIALALAALVFSELLARRITRRITGI